MDKYSISDNWINNLNRYKSMCFFAELLDLKFSMC